MLIEKAKNTLRLVALATTDSEATKCCLDVLGETSAVAKIELGKTCYKEDVTNLRGAMIENNKVAESKQGKEVP